MRTTTTVAVSLGSPHDAPGQRHAGRGKGVGHAVYFAWRFRAVHRGTRCEDEPREQEQGRQAEAPDHGKAWRHRQLVHSLATLRMRLPEHGYRVRGKAKEDRCTLRQ